MSEFTNDARKMLELVGGRENIVSFTHCATRMRFVLADDKKADVKGIEALSCVKGSFTQGGQFQVIIGNRVSQFYDEFSAVSNMDGVDKQEVKKAAKGNMNLLQRAVANLAEIFAPIIPAIIVGGLILGFRNIIGDIKLLEDGTKAITEVYPFWSGVYNFLWLAGEAIFTFLPVGVTWSVCKKMNVDQMLGIVLGITLVSPQLMSASDYVAAVEAGDPVKYWDFGSFHINMVGYQSQVIPAILVGLVFAVIYRFLKKHVPEIYERRVREGASRQLFKTARVFKEIECAFKSLDRATDDEAMKRRMLEEIKTGLCSNCARRDECKRTDVYEGFARLFHSGCIKGRVSLVDLPAEITTACTRPAEVISAVNGAITRLKKLTAEAESAQSGRQLLANQARGIADVLKAAAVDMERSGKNCADQVPPLE